jgi:peptide/nickel transport system permease protein
VTCACRCAGHRPSTYLGLLAVTFFIGRVIPVDPALAIVGDRAPST